MPADAARLGLTIMMGAIALAWMLLSAQTAKGLRRIPRLSDVRSLPDSALPSVSLLFSARDEAEKMPAALRSMLALNYPGYEVIGTDDRSTDRTPEILREFAATCKLLRPVRVEALPPGWLGKPHGLQAAYERATGDWLVFTDADVTFHPETLRYAVSLALERNWDHLTLFPQMEMSGFWEKTLLTYFQLGGLLYSRAWQVPDRDSQAYAGVGAFQLLRRTTYESIGTHRRLALEVVDDMKLGKLVKAEGFVSGVAMADGMLRVRWQSGIGNIFRGTEKNFFAAAGFQVGKAVTQIGVSLILSVLPFLALVATGGWSRIFAGVAAACAVALQASAARASGASPLYAVTHPLGALLMCLMLARSTLLTLWNGGIYWRGTFYPLDELRRGAV